MVKTLQRILFWALPVLGLISCTNDSLGPNADTASATGKGGSMARFAISGDYLYTVDNTKLHLYDISTPADPQVENELPLSFGVETIFPYENKLFIGTQSGMLIYDIEEPSQPRQLALYQHVTSCDPVVTDGRYAYVTLSSGRPCSFTAPNVLEVVDLQSLSSPALLKQYEMVNPKGLGIDKNLLFVCDDGLKMYDASDVMSLQLLQHLDIKAYDVIPDNGRLLVIGSDGFYQFRYDQHSLSLLSKIEVNPPAI